MFPGIPGSAKFSGSPLRRFNRGKGLADFIGQLVAGKEFLYNRHGRLGLSNQEPSTTKNESLLRMLVRLSYNGHGPLWLSNQEPPTTNIESLFRTLVRLSYKNIISMVSIQMKNIGWPTCSPRLQPHLSAILFPDLSPPHSSRASFSVCSLYLLSIVGIGPSPISFEIL